MSTATGGTDNPTPGTSGTQNQASTTASTTAGGPPDPTPPAAATGAAATDGGNSDSGDAWADATEDSGSDLRLNTRSSSYTRTPGNTGGGKGKGRGKKSKDPVLADRQKDALETWAANAAMAMQRAAVVVGDVGASPMALDAAVAELVGIGSLGVSLDLSSMSVRARNSLEQLRERRKAELEASLGILRRRRAGEAPPAVVSGVDPVSGGAASGGGGTGGGGGSTVAGGDGSAASGGGGVVEDPTTVRLRSLSESAAVGPGLGLGLGRGRGGGLLGAGSGGGGAAVVAPGGSSGGGSSWGGGTAGQPAASGGNATAVGWPMFSGNLFSSNLDPSRPEYWLEFPYPWNVVPPKATDLKPGDVMKITVAHLPKFHGPPEEYAQWRQAFLPCVHSTPIDISLKIMTLMGTLVPQTAQLREIRANFIGNGPGYRATIALLEKTFGGAHNLLVSRQQSLLAVPHLKEGNFAGLEVLHIRLGTFLLEWGGTMGGGGEVNSLAFFHLLMGKLEANFARKFVDWAQQHGTPTDLRSLHAWAGEQLEVHRRVESYSRQLWNLGGMGRGAPPVGGRVPYQGGGKWGGGRSPFTQGQAGPSSGAGPMGAQYKPNTYLYEQGEDGWHEVEEDFGGEAAEGHFLHDGGGGQPPSACGLCGEGHPVGRCPQFRKKTPQERREWLAEQGRCYSCFQPGHNIRTCRLQYRCKKCGDLHNTALHGSRRTGPPVPRPAGAGAASGTNLYVGEGGEDWEGADWVEEQTFLHRPNGREAVSLRTIGLWLGNPRGGREEYVTALLDDGSTGSVLVSDELASALQLTGHVMRTATEGVGGKLTLGESLMSTVRIRSQDGKLVRSLPAQVMARPAGSYAPVDWNEIKNQYAHLRGLEFPPLSKKWSGVHLLLGSRNSHLLSSLEERSAGEHLPVGRRTPLGWTATGRVDAGRLPLPGPWRPLEVPAEAQEQGFFQWMRQGGELQQHFRHSQKDQGLQRLVERMWALEELPEGEELSPSEHYVLRLMQEKQERQGRRYMLPCTWKPGNTRPGRGYQSALQRLESLERSAVFRNATVRKKYQEVISEWEEEKVTVRVEPGPATQHYIAHFPVCNLDKLSSKVRPVMDCSVALNEHLLAGPQLMNEVVQVLLRFRSGLVAFSGDVAKMFLRIHLRPEDRPYHCFLWRESPREELIHYQFQSHVFGNKGSPFVAIYALREQARQWERRYPEAAETLSKSALVDDILDSVDDVGVASRLMAEVREVLEDMGMEVKKCMSSHPAVLASLPEGSRAEELLDLASLGQEEVGNPRLKALGILYQPRGDFFTFRMELKQPKKWTKREILKVFPRLYDPLGLLLPYVMPARWIFSQVARQVADWDEELSLERLRRWLRWVAKLGELPEVRIPRCVKKGAHTQKGELHVFCDASGEGYCAAAYLLVRDEERTEGSVRLVFARGKVAPGSQPSIPRLELLAAVLGTEVQRTVHAHLKIRELETHYWSDSLNVLFWLRNETKRLQTFVENKVRKIRAQSTLEQWHWVPTSLNPADIPTRGQGPSELARNSLWWNGPAYLSGPRQAWPRSPRLEPTPDGVKEFKKVEQVFVEVRQAAGGEEEVFPFARIGTWKKAIRVAQWLLTWRRQKGTGVSPAAAAEVLLLRQIQLEYRRAAAGGTSEAKRKLGLHQLAPFTDENGVVRGRGRLVQVVEVPRDAREPIFLPRQHPGTRLLVKHLHEEGARHVGGVNHTLARLHERFWVPKPRQLVYRLLQECIPCRRRLARPQRPPPGPLPKFRVPLPEDEPLAFTHTGIDCAGPFRVKRGRAVELHYLLLLTCCKTRAVRLEMLSSLGVDSFLQALTRAAERGVRPSMLLSDNGTNFQAAHHLQGTLWAILREDKERLQSACPDIKWRFNPPYASHWGGVFERLIGSVKRALYHALPGTSLFTMEQLQTAFAIVEGTLNSRPLAYLSGEAGEPAPLTPNHFLYGSASRPVQVVPAGGPQHLARRWLQVQEAAGVFWERLQREIRPHLQLINKQKRGHYTDLRAGDIVAFLHPTCRGRWPLARVKETYPGKDGRVRSILVTLPQIAPGREYQRLRDRELRRDVSSVVLLLPAEEEGPAPPTTLEEGDGAEPGEEGGDSPSS